MRRSGLAAYQAATVSERCSPTVSAPNRHARWSVVVLAFIAALPLGAQVRHTMFPPARGTHEMVGAANNFEVEAGFRFLMQGGNAIDWGVDTVLADAVTEQARLGLGG